MPSRYAALAREHSAFKPCAVARSILHLMLANKHTGTASLCNPPQVHKALEVYQEMVSRWACLGLLCLQGGTQRTPLSQVATAAAVSAPLHTVLPPPGALPVPRGVHPSVTTFNCLLAAASDSGSYEALLEVGRGRGRGWGGSRREGGRAGARRACLHSQRQADRSRQCGIPSSTSPKQSAAASASRLVSPSPLPYSQVGRALGAADPDTKAACMNAYVAGLVKVGAAPRQLASLA